MNIDNAYPSRYLKAANLEGHPLTLTIGQVMAEQVDGQNKPVMYFQDMPMTQALTLEGRGKGLMLNKTNAGIIKDLYGPETDTWFGRQIEVYPSQTDYQGKLVDCLRVRAPQAAVGGQAMGAQQAATQAAAQGQAPLNGPHDPPTGHPVNDPPFNR